MFKLICMQQIKLDCPNSKYQKHHDDHGMIQDACTIVLYSKCNKDVGPYQLALRYL